MNARKAILLQTREYTSEKRWLSWWHLVSALALFVSLSLLSFFDLSWMVLVPASFLSGLLIVRLFILYHDYEHGTILRGSWIAWVIMKIYGLLVLSPPSIWKRSHEHHHRNTAQIYGASIGSYPVLTPEAYARSSWGQRMLYSISRHPVTIAMGYATIFMYGMCIRSLMMSPRKHFDSILSITLHGTLIVLLACFFPKVLLFSMLVPMTIACALGAYIFYAQHNYPSVKLRDRAEWDYLYAALYSSAYIDMGKIMHWFTGNIGYHHVHHLNPRIPFYRLPEAMAGIPALQTPGRTSLSVADVWRCFRLKLWDPAQDRMVGFRRWRKAAMAAMASKASKGSAE